MDSRWREGDVATTEHTDRLRKGLVEHIGKLFLEITRELITRPDAHHPLFIRVMERSRKSSKDTSKNGGSKRSSKPREPSEQVHTQAHCQCAP
jgi:hypothetical protein